MSKVIVLLIIIMVHILDDIY